MKYEQASCIASIGNAACADQVPFHEHGGGADKREEDCGKEAAGQFEPTSYQCCTDETSGQPYRQDNKVFFSKYA